jgi:hypothetical protein
LSQPASKLGHEVEGFGRNLLGGQVMSPSFSPSSSSTTTIMRPARISSIAVGTSMKAWEVRQLYCTASISTEYQVGGVNLIN